MTVHCGSGSCTATLDAPDMPAAELRRYLWATQDRHGWRWHHEPGDVDGVPVCPRCAD